MMGRSMLVFLIVAWFALAAIQCQQERMAAPERIPAKPVVLTTVASWYDYELNGRAWSTKNATCASRDYARGTRLLITNVANGKRITCRVNDYIMHPERGIDLSSYAFSKIASLGRGLITVRIEREGE